MCGIVGYIGTEKKATKFVLNGLQTLEYRGYDSAGIATVAASGPVTIKQAGQVEGLKQAVESSLEQDTSVAIGHTRWATHGAPTTMNAHPHCNEAGTIFVVHNGIIENYQALRQRLIKQGYAFVSETDTEVIPHLIDFHYKQLLTEAMASRLDAKAHLSSRSGPSRAKSTVKGARTDENESIVPKTADKARALLENLSAVARSQCAYKAFQAAIKELEGAYAIAALFSDEPDSLYVARLSSPLVIGVGKTAHVVASDPSALLDTTKKVVFLDDYEVAKITSTNLEIHHIRKNISVNRVVEKLDYNAAKAELGGYPHFMIKEINEAPQTIQSASRGRIRPETNTIKLGGLDSVAEQLRYIDRIIIVACGTSYYAGLVGEYLIEEIAGIPVEVQLASEFKYRKEPLSRSTALLAISQSGETADTIAALKKVENYGILRLGVVNAVGSTIARMTDAGVYCHAGPEQSVASTKAFMAQVTILAEIALYLSQGKNPLYKPVLQEITKLPVKALEVLGEDKNIKKLAKKYAKYRDFLFIGRGTLYPCALEGALKLKEVSYIHAEGYASGEMKHGPLAMIDKNFPTFALACDSPLLDKTLSNIEEIRARSGPVVAVATKGNKSVTKLTSDVIYIPDTLEQLQPLLVAIVVQLFAYHVAVEKAFNVDRPRNLAKSVTVE